MIFAMFGTNPYQFTRLAKALDDFGQKTWKEVEVQCGNTRYDFKHCKAKPFLPHEEVLKKIAAAECVILQGGAGSISDGIRFGKAIVVVPRRPELNESPDHQELLVRKLDSMGCITAVYDVSELEAKYREALVAKRNLPPANKIPEIIANYLKDRPINR